MKYVQYNISNIYIMAIIISISNHKGGVAKTTTVINLGAGLVNKKKKVLLIDSDPQANLTQGLGVSDELEDNLYTAYKSSSKVEPVNIRKGLDLIPSTLDLAATELEISSRMNRESVLKKIIKKVEEDYDYILIDCPPSLGLLTINAYTASNFVLIPLLAEFFSLKGLSRLDNLLSQVQEELNPNLELGGVFVTQLDKRLNLHDGIKEAVEEYFGDKALKTAIHKNVAIAESQTKGLDIFTYDKKSKGAKDYKDLTKEILKIL